eukprot:scaffold32129_cov39-Prasinocladus_malaysianus.AAC.1
MKLLKSGESPNTVDGSGLSLLGTASLYGYADVVQGDLDAIAPLLTDVRRRILLEQSLPAGGTALNLAATQGNVDMVKALLQAGAPVDLSGPDYSTTPMISAARNRHSGVVTVLLRAGAAPDLVDEAGLSVLYISSEMGHLATVSRLLASDKRHVIVKQRFRNGNTALHVAAAKGHTDVVRMLCWSGSEIDAQENIRGATSLLVAAYNGHREVVKALLQLGAAPDMTDRNGQTALFCSSVEGHVDTVKALLQAGADVNAVDHTNATALHVSARAGHKAVVRCLLKHPGTKLRIQDSSNCTAHELAFTHEHGELARYIATMVAKRTCSNPDCDSEGHGMKVCERCTAVRYCSRKCQKAHWRSSHKATCLAPKMSTASP